jgi:NAD(P)H-dependent nitrite reductase small subunit
MAEFNVCQAADIPKGRGLEVLAAGRQLAVFHVDGEYFCIDNLCPHHAGPLAEGDLEGDVVLCPWHAWEINVRTGAVFDSPNFCVARYPCRVEDGAVLVEIG